MRFKKLNLIEQNSFKRRKKYKIKKKINLRYGTFGIITYQNCRFEYNYINLVRRSFKAILRNKYTRVKIVNIWVFLKANFPISKKSKNARMGKGIGSFVRWSIKLPRNFIVIEVLNGEFIRFKTILDKWTKMLPFKLLLIKK